MTVKHKQMATRCASAYVTDGRKTPPLELTEALQIGRVMTRS
jgi:hypothetical protein